MLVTSPSSKQNTTGGNISKAPFIAGLNLQPLRWFLLCLALAALLFTIESDVKPVLAEGVTNPIVSCDVNVPCQVQVNFLVKDDERDSVQVKFCANNSSACAGAANVSLLWCSLNTSTTVLTSPPPPPYNECSTPWVASTTDLMMNALGTYQFSSSGSYTVGYQVCDDAGH